MIRMTHYLYVLSTWSLVAESAVEDVRTQFGADLVYDWRLAVTGYGGGGQLRREDLEFYYARLAVATGEKMNPGWWRDGYNWLVPDGAAMAARLLGATGSQARLALANAALRDGRDVTNVDVALDIASATTGIDMSALREMYDSAHPYLALKKASVDFAASGVNLRPAFVFENDLGDRAVLSGIWNAEPMVATIAALLEDERSYYAFIASTPPPDSIAGAVLSGKVR